MHLCDGKNGRGVCEYFHKDGRVKQSLDVKPKSVQKQEEKEAKSIIIEGLDSSMNSSSINNGFIM